MPSASYSVEDDELIVDWTYSAAIGTYNLTGTIYAIGEEQNAEQYSDTFNIFDSGGSRSGTLTARLNDLGIDPGETTGVFVTIVMERQSTGEIDQLQEEVEVTRADNVNLVSLECAGLNPENPIPGEQFTITADVEYTGSQSFPTVDFRALLYSPNSSDTLVNEEYSRQIGSSGTHTFAVDIPSTAEPGSEWEVMIDAINIEGEGSV